MTDRSVNTERTAPKRRGRTPDPDRTASTRRAVLDAATRTFLARGYAKTTMSAVAREAGVAKGTLYLYFATKAELFEGVLTAAMQRPLGAIDVADGRDSVRDMLLATAIPALRGIEQDGRADLIRLILREGPDFPDVTRAYRSVVMEPGWAMISALARRARAAGELKTDALEREPILLVAPAIAATLWNGLFPDQPKSAADAVEAFIREVFVDTLN